MRNLEKRLERSSQNLKKKNECCSELCSKDSQNLIVKIPIRLRSEANLQEHWTKKHKRKKDVQRAILYALNPLKKPSLPCKITLTRIAPRSLDFDNLATAMKSAIDQTADWLVPGLQAGRADGSSMLEFKLDQRRGEVKEYALEIKFEEIHE